jgi:hypothetical protein
MDSLFLGAILAISSTTITINSLADLGKSKEKFAQVISRPDRKERKGSRLKAARRRQEGRPGPS